MFLSLFYKLFVLTLIFITVQNHASAYTIKTTDDFVNTILNKKILTSLFFKKSLQNVPIEYDDVDDAMEKREKVVIKKFISNDKENARPKSAISPKDHRSYQEKNSRGKKKIEKVEPYWKSDWTAPSHQLPPSAKPMYVKDLNITTKDINTNRVDKRNIYFDLDPQLLETFGHNHQDEDAMTVKDGTIIWTDDNNKLMIYG